MPNQLYAKDVKRLRVRKEMKAEFPIFLFIADIFSILRCYLDIILPHVYVQGMIQFSVTLWKLKFSFFSFLTDIFSILHCYLDIFP